MYKDRLITLLSKEKKIHGYITVAKDSARALQNNHRMNIVSTALFSRALASCILLSGNLKNDKDSLSLSWNCSGPARSIYVEANGEGKVRGYIGENNLTLIEKSISGDSILAEPYIGFGDLTLRRDSAYSKTPYSSVTVIETGEIASDISIHLEQSMQIESALKIGLSIDNENNIEICGGLLFMAMPGCKKEDIDILHKVFEEIGSLTELLKISDDNFSSVIDLFKPLGMEIISERRISFSCGCNENKIKNVLKSLKKEDIAEYYNDENKIEANCQYCGRKYIFNETNLE